MSKIGYNHPSQANWNYGIWKIDLIDTAKPYCQSITVRENFGGYQQRLRRTIKEKTDYQIIETNGVYTKTGLPKITGISNLLDIEGEKIETKIIKFITK